MPPNQTYATNGVLCQGFLRTAVISLLLVGVQHRPVAAVCPRSRFTPPSTDHTPGRSDPNSTCCVAAGQLPCTRGVYARYGCTNTTCVPDYEFHGNENWPKPYSGNVTLDSAVAPGMQSIGKGTFHQFRGQLAINGTGWTDLGAIGDYAFQSIGSSNGAGGLVVFVGQSLRVLNSTTM